MPARKPLGLSNRHDTKADRSARTADESAMTPGTQLTVATPPRLRRHAHAAATWKRIVGLYGEIDATIATAFDQDLLTKYCLLDEEAIELEKMRRTTLSDWEANQKKASKIKPTADNMKEWVQMWAVVNAMHQRFQGMDARLDGKRKLMHALEQSLYLTPRSRAGVAPNAKEPEEPQSDMEEMVA